MSTSARVGYFYSPLFLEHITDRPATNQPQEPHPESPDRLRAIHHELDSSGLLNRLTCLDPKPATRGELARVHEPTMLDRVEALAAQGGGLLDEDTAVSPGSLAAALAAAGAGIQAVDAMMAGTLDRAFLAVRPPGHHATGSRSMGFCLFNNVAVAAAHAIAHHGIKRVAILDWDLHHGNGTQDIFYSRGDVFYISLHQYPLYPGTGAAREAGEGEGHGSTLNIPLPAGAGDELFLNKLRTVVAPALKRYAPQLILISAGFDAHADDPLGSLEVSDEGYRKMTELLLAVAREHTAGKLISFLEGGYNLPALARSVRAHVEALLVA